MNTTSNRLTRIRNHWLDIVAPLEAWLLAMLARDSWAGHEAQKALRQSSRSKKTWIEAQFHRGIEKIMGPEGWPLALLLAIILVGVPQVIFLFGRGQLSWLTLPFQQPIQQSEPPQFQITSVLMTAWQVLAAVIGLTFVIVIFLTQFVHERAFERRAFPLFVTHTWMIFTVIFGLLTVLSMGVAVLMINNPAFSQDNTSNIAFYNSFLFALNIVLTIRLYIRTYQLVNPRRFRAIFLRYNREQVLRSVEAQLRRRFAEQIVFEKCKAANINLALWRADREPGTTSVKLLNLSSESTEISNVNLRLLALASDRARALSGETPFARLEFIGPIGNRFSAERPEIAYIPQQANRPQVTRLLQRAVRLRPMFEDDVTDDDLQLNRDLISDEIKAGRASGVKELLDQYLESLQAFLQAIDTHGLRYSLETARRENGYLLSWKVVSQIQEHYYRLAEQALQSSDHEILYHYVSFPWKVMSLSLQYRDQFVFQRFADAYTLLYAVAKHPGVSDDSRRYVYEWCWKYFINFYMYQIRPRLEHPEIDPAHAQTLGDYADYIILVLNRLLKRALDYQDLEQFGHFAGALRQMGTWLLGNSPIEEVKSLGIRLEFTSDVNARRRIEDDIKQKCIAADQLLRIHQSRRQCYFGLGGWLMHLTGTGTISPSAFREFISIINAEFTNIEDFTMLYSRILIDSSVGDPYEWDHWEMNERPESYGEIIVHSIQSSNWLADYYLYRALDLSLLNLDSIPELATTSASGRLVEVVEERLTEFKASPVWSKHVVEVVGSRFEERAAALREMLAGAARRQHVFEEDDLIGQPLDQARINDFMARIRKRWHDNSVLRGLIMNVDNYGEKREVDVPTDLLPLGVSQLDDKGAFVAQNRVHYGDWGDQYGRALARGEDEELCKAFSMLPTTEAEINGFDALITNALDELRQKHAKPIILYDGWSMPFYESKRFVHSLSSQLSIPNQANVQGMYDDAVVVKIPALESNCIIVVDLRRFGVLRQYKPNGNEQFPLFISVEEITQKRAEELLQQQPGLAIDPESKATLDKYNAVRQLRQLVLVGVYERFRFEDIDASAGRRLRFLATGEHVQSVGKELVAEKVESHNESVDNIQQVMTSAAHSRNSRRLGLLSASVAAALAGATLVAGVMIRRSRSK